MVKKKDDFSTPFTSVGSSHIEGVEYETSFASSMKNENLNLSTSVAHTKKVLSYY
jgi:hypothetical protein